MQQVQCQRCGKRIEKRGARKYCLQCRKEVDDELARVYTQKHLKHKKEVN